MEPTRPKPASRSSSRASSQYVDAVDNGDVQQYGRSPLHAAAQASAQSLREASRVPLRTPSRSSSTPNLLRKKQKAQAQAQTPTLAIPGQQRQYHPAVSSPLNPVPSNISRGPSVPPSTRRSNSDEGAASTSSASEDSAARSKAATVAGTALAAQIAATPPVTRNGTPRQPEMSQTDSPLSLTRQTTPRTVRDLGSDYTRYFNPFASRNNSQQDLNSLLPRYNSSTHLMAGAGAGISQTDLHKRLSDPFEDSKRYSNPFDSRPHTSPGTPLQKQMTPLQPSPEEEKTAGTTAATSTLSLAVPSMTPQRTGTPGFIREADPEKSAFFPYMDDRLGAPEYAFPLYSDQKEDDDDLHMPQWDDDIKMKPSFKDHFTRENVLSTIGLFFMLVGLLCIFVILPIISYTTVSLLDYTYETPLKDMPQAHPAAEAWATVNNKTYPLMENMRTGLIDPDTPNSAGTRTGVDGDEYLLVFSDEFNAQNRSFWPGDDPYWTGGNFWYGATQDLEWYDPDAINTGDGTLQIQMDEFMNHGLNYRSGMLNSWNQICFKGGIFEVGVSLPGPAGVHGLWPGVWSMGNLGRPGYLATTDGMWPYTYSDCDAGITPNQSMTDGTSNLPGQRLPSCSCEGEDHPTPGNGRGAPEIDIIEVSGDWGGHGWAVATQSFQVAPFDIWYYPNYDFMETPNYQMSFVNTYTGGPYQQAVSTTTILNNAWYDGNEYQKYAYEYAPGDDQNAFIAWTVGDNEEMMKFDARAVGPNGNVGQRLVSEEPMSMVLNLGMSHGWVDIDWANLKFPTVMRIDYVRLYQKDGEQMVTCDPPGYETTQYIADHPLAYQNPNVTHWADAGYSRVKNSLMDGCAAAEPSGSGS